MDHRWDEATWQDRASRAERERYGTSRIADDPDVERRDRMRAEERIRSINQSPWNIGEAWYDQRDLFTRNASIEEDGYGVGPSVHPEDGSYAYHREAVHLANGPVPEHASLQEREAWPWLNYKEPEEDPYFSYLHEDEPHDGPGRPEPWWKRFTGMLESALHGHQKHVDGIDRSEGKIELDAEMALMRRSDLDSSDIKVSVKGRDVTLEGTVRDRRSKHIAEESVEGVRGVREVHNRLTIRRDEPTDADVAFVLPLALLGGV
jgi:hypothetical protein